MIICIMSDFIIIYRMVDISMKKNIVAIDLFSGCGGTSSGLSKAGIDVRVAVEINGVAIETYQSNLESHVIHKDISKVKKNELLNKVNLKDDEALLLVACPPCQGFSSIGNGDENDLRNQLVFQFVRLVRQLKPSYLLMENVAGMSRGKGKKIFKEVLSQLDSLGYVVKFDILNSADYGVPQMRKRLVLHGVRKGIYRTMKRKNIELELPKPTHINPDAKNNPKNLPNWNTAETVFGLPQIEAGEKYESEDIFNHFANGLSDFNKKKMDYIRKNGGSRDCLPEELVLECHKKKTGHNDVYGIIDINKPAPTMTGGCMSYTKGRFGHPFENRALSAREAARIQSFEDDFKFIGTNSDIALQIGNAVPVKLAEASGKYFQELNKKLCEK